MTQWIADHAQAIAATAERELEALAAISSPSGDVAAAEEAVAVAGALLPSDALLTRLPCSSPGHAPDFEARMSGTGGARILLVGHLDTVIGHAAFEAPRIEGDKLLGSGTIDMKGGDVLALGVLRALGARRADIAEVALLLVCDEEWRTAPFAHTRRYAGWDACLCFEAGERDEEGREAVVVRRKAAGTVQVRATGRSSHSGAAPDDGANALLALADVAQRIAALHDPRGALHLTAVPTILRSGEAFNVVPGHGELVCDVRADTLEAFAPVLAAVPERIGDVTLDAQQLRSWPGMDAGEAAAPVLVAAGDAIGRPILGRRRGGASDASHFAGEIPLTIDGLGPLGALAHAPGEHVLRSSLLPRAEVALAVADAVLASAG